MKRLLSIVTLVMFLFVLTACGIRENTPGSPDSSGNPSGDPADQEEPSDSEDRSFAPSEWKDTDFDTSGDITFTPQYPVYGKDIARIAFFLENHTEQELVYGEDYSVEKLVDGSWYTIPFPENTGFNAIGIILAPKGTNAVNIDLSFLDYNFTDGTYRVVKWINDKRFFGSFELGESKITGDTPYGYADLESLPQDYSKEQGIQDGVLVVVHDEIHNPDKLKAFIRDVSRNASSMLRIMQYTTEGDPIFTDITYVAGYGQTYYTVKRDSSRDAFGGENKGVSESIYSCMVTDGTKIYLSNYTSYAAEEGNHTRELFYYSDDSVWTELIPIVQEMTESRRRWNSAIYRAFSPDGKSSVILTENPLEFGIDATAYGELHNIENKMNMAVKIVEAVWADNHTLLFVCETDTAMKYYEFFDIAEKKVISYTASVHDYYMEDGEIFIPE